MRPGRAVIASTLLGLATALPAFAGDPTGLWLTEKGDARVRVGRCGGALCGSIVWLKAPNDPATGKPSTDENNPDPTKRTRPLLGIHIVFGMKPSGTPDKWMGRFYNPDDGKTYEGRLSLIEATSLRAEGCLAVFCSGETWTRVK